MSEKLKKIRNSSVLKGVAAILQTVSLIILISSIIFATLVAASGIPWNKTDGKKHSDTIYKKFCEKNENEILDYYGNYIEMMNPYNGYEEVSQEIKRTFEKKYSEESGNGYFYCFVPKYCVETGKQDTEEIISYENYYDPDYVYSKVSDGLYDQYVLVDECSIDIDLKEQYENLVEKIVDRSAFVEYEKHVEFNGDYRYSIKEDIAYCDEYSDYAARYATELWEPVEEYICEKYNLDYEDYVDDEYEYETTSVSGKSDTYDFSEFYIDTGEPYVIADYSQIKTVDDAKKKYPYSELKTDALTGVGVCDLYFYINDAWMTVSLLDNEKLSKYKNEVNVLGFENDEYYVATLSEGKENGTLTVDVKTFKKQELEYSITSYIKNDAEEFGTIGFIEKIAGFASHLKNFILISAIIFLLATAFLMYASGHTEGREGIYINKMSRIPIDIFTLGILLLLLFEILCVDDHCFDYRSWNYIVERVQSIDLWITSDRFWMVLAIMEVFIVADSIIFAVYTYSLAVNIKAGNLIKGSLIARACKKLGSVVKFCVKNIGYSIKTLIVYWGIAFMEAIVIYQMSYIAEPSDCIVLLILIKTVGTVCIIYYLANIKYVMNKAKNIAEGKTDTQPFKMKLCEPFKEHEKNLDCIDKGIQAAVDEQVKSQRMKAELITNVSHDIKTPVTSIINYVDLLKKEDIDNETAVGYIEVLDRQSGRLKKLIQDLLDASKASTGNLDVNIEKINLLVLLEQIEGENEERLIQKGINIVRNCKIENATETGVYVMADGRHLYRAIDNLIQNIIKYAAENTRTYIDIEEDNEYISVAVKNISKEQLNISGDELTERFVRGDKSRNTEGSGLGLSIAKSLMELQGGSLDIIIDGDLFKAIVNIKKV